MLSRVICNSWQCVQGPWEWTRYFETCQTNLFQFWVCCITKVNEMYAEWLCKVWLPMWHLRQYLVCMSHREWTDCLGIPQHTVHISCLRSLEDSHMLLVRQCPRNMCGQTCKSSHTNTQRCGKVAMQYMTLKLESITSVFLLFLLLLSRKWKWEKKHINIKQNLWSLWQHRQLSSSNWGLICFLIPRRVFIDTVCKVKVWVTNY
jgi:hypothetical protein